MKINAINYQKHWRNDGTVYRQTITINKKLMDKYNNLLKKEYKRLKEQRIFSNEDMKIKYYTFLLKKWSNFLHLTWLYYFWNIVLQYKIDTKNRLKLDRNTIIKVK